MGSGVPASRHVGRPRLDEEVLVVVGRPDVEDLEAGRAEQPRQRAGGEVGAVLVVDVPEPRVAQHVQRAGQLEEHGGVTALADAPRGPGA